MASQYLTSERQVTGNYYFDEGANRNFNYFFAGFILYTSAFIYSTIDLKNYVIALPFQSIGIVAMIFYGIKLIKPNIHNKYLFILFTIYCIWFLLVIIRGFLPNYQFIKDLLFDAEHGLLLYLLPLVLLFPQNIFFYKKLFTVIVILAGIFIVYDLVFLNKLLNVSNYFTDLSSPQYAYEHFVKSLSVTSGFLILTYRYQPVRVRWFSLLVALTAILFAIIRARRGLLFLSICPLVIGSIIYAIMEKKKLLFLGIYVVIISIFMATSFKKNSTDNGIFGLLVDRVDADSRSPVEHCFYADMKTTDWIIGRGMNGQYYCPDIDLKDKTGYRDVIETDYLNIILKGGLISITLLLLITIPAIIKGLFFSKNLFCKAAAIWILLWLIDLYPSTVNTFTLNYLLVWISIGICYNKTFLDIPESLMTQYFFAVNDIAKKLPVE
jgi:hypothetical protein